MNFKEKPFYNFLKRLFDIVFSFLFLLVFFIFYVIVAVIVAVSDKQGKPFFVQERVGKNGRIFKLYKFRTMCTDAEEKKISLEGLNEADGPVFKIKDDPRITKVGKVLRKTNIDEFPQMLNILKGDMSFVGPRPPLPDEVEQYREEDKIRLAVKPGLTCYWQSRPNRNDISFDEWMELDRKYIEDRGIWTDIRIIFRTACVILKNRDGR